ncbi:DUF1223 domain-containing protein [Kordiimonas marina]|uniref:DUF1223 domain-containing protein n=1 Tax=Kordiimonas marina TaxID=2872312 RepID=UPI001FF37BEA|nr:DUF1223 domain-containing protein [Kordiimonas marina]MCJ9428136.1 DUF1223 domain-containing protein [Kordiimonas marina]
MRKWLTVALLLVFGGLAHAQTPAQTAQPVNGAGPDNGTANQRLVVIELFTSQGCSSCPPADAALRSLRDRPGILTLSWPVNYWDRLGWEDTFAKPNNGMRQAAYNKRLGRGGVFTPQMVFDGRLQCVGSKPDEIRMGIAKERAIKSLFVSPVIKQSGSHISVSLPETALKKDATVRVVWYLGDAEVEVGGGENSGRLLHYTNVVRRTDILKDWDGRAVSLSLDAKRGEAAGADHVAILLQSGYRHGPIVGAASLTLNTPPKVFKASMP